MLGQVSNSARLSINPKPVISRIFLIELETSHDQTQESTHAG